jgi:hypothetical protein
MQSLQNAYLCENLVAPARARTGARALRTGLEGPDMPKDLHPMIWGYVFEAERAERYRARQLRFRFFGIIDRADREALLQGLNEYDRLRFATHDEAPPFMRRRLMEVILQRLEPRLSAVFHALFRSTEDRVNLAGDAWTQIVFQITNIHAEITDPGYLQRHGVDFAHLEAASADGLHRIRLRFTRLPVGGPYASVSIQYVGPQRFRTFDEYNHLQSQGGTLEEMGAAAGRETSDPRVFEGWRRREAE